MQNSSGMNPRDLSERVSKNFTRGEFEVADSDVEISNDIVTISQTLRDHLGRPLYISSGVRTPEQNSRVGGSPRSSHLLGYACDIADNKDGRDMDNVIRYEIVSKLTGMGVPRIGIAKTFIHFDVDPEKQHGIIWLY